VQTQEDYLQKYGLISSILFLHVMTLNGGHLIIRSLCNILLLASLLL